MRDEYKVSAYMLPTLTLDEMHDNQTPYVYFMFSESNDVLLYVGQTNNMRRRIQEHSAALEEMAELLEDDSLRSIHYRGIKVDVKELDEVEQYYIKRYCPPRNVMHNSPDVVRAYELWYYEKLLVAYNKNRAKSGELPMTFDEAYGGKMCHTA